MNVFVFIASLFSWISLQYYDKKAETWGWAVSQDVWIENEKCVQDGIYQINNEQLKILYFDYKNQPEKLPEQIKFERMPAQYQQISRTFKTIKINTQPAKKTQSSR